MLLRTDTHTGPEHAGSRIEDMSAGARAEQAGRARVAVGGGGAGSRRDCGRKVALWLGHADIRTTELYLRLNPTEKIEAVVLPHDHWIEPWERQAIIDQHPLEGYRRLTFMMLDDDVVTVSPATVHRVLRASRTSLFSRQTRPLACSLSRVSVSVALRRWQASRSAERVIGVAAAWRRRGSADQPRGSSSTILIARSGWAHMIRDHARPRA